MPRFALCLAGLAVLLASAPAARAQTPRPVPPDASRADTSHADTSRTATRAPRAPADSSAADPVRAGQGLPLAPPADGGLEAPVTFTARDSVRIVLAPRRGQAPDARPDDVVALFGDVTATYETATIRAARLTYRSAAEELRAEPLVVDTGVVGLPAFADGEEQFTGRLFVYNLRSRRGRVTGARTQVEDGYLLGGVIKQRDAHVIYAQDAAYTTCALDHPHYALEAGRLKIVDGRRVYSGPVRLRLLGLPTPLWLPFGYFPAAQGRRSGPLPVRYGSESGFGLFLDNLGWYWALSDYLDAQVAGKLGTEGSFQVGGTLRYARRYAYQGVLDLSYGRLRQGESTDPGFAPRVPMGVRWTHSQTFGGGPQLSASVNLQSTSQRLVSTAVSQQLQQSTSSTVSLAQTWPRAGRSVSLGLQASQDFTTGSAALTLPSFSFQQQRRFPFKRGRDDSWLDRLSLSYGAQGTNAYAFRPLSDSTGVSFLDGLVSLADYQRATGRTQRFASQVVQTVPLQTSFRADRFNLSLVPALTFTETWVGQREARTWRADSSRLDVATEPGFTAVRRLRASAEASTELFGTFPLRVGRLDGVRHVVRPRVSFELEPDYAAWGSVREVQVDTTGRTQRYAIVPGLPTDPTRSLSFSVDNAILARLARPDSTGEVQRQTVQVLSFSVSGGVNFAAETRPVRDLALAFTTTLGGVSASGQAGFSAYALDGAGRLTDLSYYEATGRPVRLTTLSARAGRSFSFGGAPGAATRPVVAPLPAPPPGPDYDPARPLPPSTVVGFADFAAPLSFSLDVTLSHTPAFGTVPARTTATLSVPQFSYRLTPQWALTGSTGLDLTSGVPTQTAFGLRRDLHCWELQIDWRPIGIVRGFGVSLAVKSGYLRDLLRIDVPRTTVRTLPF